MAQQGADTAGHVDHAGTGKINKAQVGQPPAVAPGPAGLDGVDAEADDAGVDAIGGELGPLRHGTGDDGGAGGAEDQLEDEAAPSKPSNPAPNIPRVGVPMKPPATWGFHQQAIAQEDEDHGTDAEVHEVLHDDVAGVFGPREAITPPWQKPHCIRRNTRMAPRSKPDAKRCTLSIRLLPFSCGVSPELRKDETYRILVQPMVSVTWAAACLPLAMARTTELAPGPCHRRRRPFPGGAWRPGPGGRHPHSRRSRRRQ